MLPSFSLFKVYNLKDVGKHRMQGSSIKIASTSKKLGIRKCFLQDESAGNTFLYNNARKCILQQVLLPVEYIMFYKCCCAHIFLIEKAHEHYVA